MTNAKRILGALSAGLALAGAACDFARYSPPPEIAMARFVPPDLYGQGSDGGAAGDLATGPGADAATPTDGGAPDGPEADAAPDQAGPAGDAANGG